MISSWHRSIWKSIRHEYHRSDGLSYATGILRTVHISPFSSFSFLCYCKWQIWILTTGNGFTRRGYALRSAGKTKELDLITLIIGFDIILFVLPWGSSSSRLQPGVVSDLTPRKTSIVLLTLVFHRFRCRALQWDVTNGVLASAFRHVGLMDSLYCRLCFLSLLHLFSRLGMILTEYLSIMQGYDPMQPARINCLEPWCCHSTTECIFFSHSELSIGSSFCVQCAQIKGAESKIIW